MPEGGNRWRIHMKTRMFVNDPSNQLSQLAHLSLYVGKKFEKNVTHSKLMVPNIQKSPAKKSLFRQNRLNPRFHNILFLL